MSSETCDFGMCSRIINNCFVIEFGKRTGRVKTFTNSELDVVDEVVFVGGDADSELVSVDSLSTASSSK